MSSGESEAGYSGDVQPREAWDILQTNPDARLIDVRTEAEWMFVGTPDLSSLEKRTILVCWQDYPDLALNTDFVDQVAAKVVDKSAQLFFVCRSGVRSRYAAEALFAAGYKQSFNVAHGFEGDLDGDRHRGTGGGWKVSNLPWTQN